LGKAYTYLRLANVSMCKWLLVCLTPIVASEFTPVERVVATLKNLSSTYFFEDNHAPPYHYYVAPIESLGELIEDILPADAFLMDAKQSQVNVWIGRPPVTALLHFDSYHNLNVQVLGTKQFVLYGPEAWDVIHPYPFLHPSHAQSQLGGSLDNINFTAYEATLGPSDVLYIPPLWWHQVTAKSLSVSVNFWSESDQARVMAEGLNMVIAEVGRRPLLQPAKLLGAAKFLVQEFVQLLFPDPVSFLQRVVAARYSALFAKKELLESTKCPEHTPPYPWGNLPRHLAALFSSRLASVALQEVWVADMVENLVFWGLGTRGARVGAFLNSCLFKALDHNDL